MENEGWGGGWDLNPQTSGQTRDFQSLARTNEQATTVGQQEKTRARHLLEVSQLIYKPEHRLPEPKPPELKRLA